MTDRPVVVITGAGSGLGHQLAVSLAATWCLALVGRRGERLEQTRQCCLAVGAQPAHCLAIAMDVTAEGAAAAIVARCGEAFGRIDALVNNAGVARFAPLAETAPGDIRNLMETNVVAPLLLIQAALPWLRRSQGVVVNVGSVGGILSLPGRAAYGASKAALHHATRSLAQELAPDVRVNAVVPGALDTEIYDTLGWADDQVGALRTQMVAGTPLRRFGVPDDVVPWIRQLLGPAGRWVTGSLLVVDGGRSA